MLKMIEGTTGEGVDDSNCFTLMGMTDTAIRFSKSKPGGILKIQPVVSFGASEDLNDGLYGVPTFGGGIGKDFNENKTNLEAIAAYHMAAAEPASGNKVFGFELNLNAKQKISKNGMLEGEFNVFVPGDYFTKKKDVALSAIFGSSFKW